MATPSFKDKTVAVLMGGLSLEREISLISGRNCSNALRSRGYRVVEIDVGRDLATRLLQEEVNVAFLALHGNYGEDGRVQGLLEYLGVPYTGAGVLGSALAMNKIKAKEVVLCAGLDTPPYIALSRSALTPDLTAQATQTLGFPVIVKPSEEGSSLGVTKVDEPSQLLETCTLLLSSYPSILIERYIRGQEVTVGVLERGGQLQVLPILELIPKKEFYDYEAKYSEGMTQFVCPAPLSSTLSTKIADASRTIFNLLECRGYGRIDYLIEEEIPYFAELNTLPGMTDRSDLPAQAKAAGMSFDMLVETILLTARCGVEGRVKPALNTLP